MNTIHRDLLLDQLNWRYATKQFDPHRKISGADWAALEEALLLTPSSFGLQLWKFIVVTDPEVKQQLVPASWGQTKVAECSHLVVFAIKKDLNEQHVEDYVNRISEVRQAPRATLADFRDMLVGFVGKRNNGFNINDWAARQAYIALGNFLTSAALLGIDACHMEGIEPEKYNEILDLNEQGLSAVVVAAAGYRAPGDNYAALKKVRFPKEQVLVEV